MFQLRHLHKHEIHQISIENYSGCDSRPDVSIEADLLDIQISFGKLRHNFLNKHHKLFSVVYVSTSCLQ